MIVAQCKKHSLVNVAVKGVYADAGFKSFLAGCCQSCPRGKSVPEDLLFQVGGIGMVIPYFERSALGRLRVVGGLLCFLGRVTPLVPVVPGVHVAAALDLVVNGLPAKAQLPGDVGHGPLFPQQRLQADPLLVGHVVLRHAFPPLSRQMCPL